VKFNILRYVITYGGGRSFYDFKIVHKNVAQKFVRQFFSTLKIDRVEQGYFYTAEDAVGSCEVWKIEVASLNARKIKSG
jgi:hypothetical protein